MLSTWLAVMLFAATLTLVIWQPKGLGIGWTAMGGAALALICRVVTFQNVWSVTQIVWDATLAFIGIIITSTVLDQIGFFEWAALKMARAANGDGRKVFLYVIFLGALISAFFTNDGAALILTPIVLEKVKLLKFDVKHTLPFIIASGFIADTTSLPFVISNLVNIVSADYFHIEFIRYALHMLIPDIVSLLVSTVVLYLFFRKDIPTKYDPDNVAEPASAIAHQGVFRLAWVLLVALLVGYILTELLHFPVSMVTGAVAILFLLIGAIHGVIQPWRVIRDAPWSIVFFSIGMYVVVYGLQNVGITNILGTAISWTLNHGMFAGTIAMGFLAAILSSIMNNLPTVLIGALAIHTTHAAGTVREALVYANVVGSDLGPKITPIGSLATLLWLHVLKRKGITITWGQYFRMGLVLTIPTLFITLCGLYLWLACIG